MFFSIFDKQYVIQISKFTFISSKPKEVISCFYSNIQEKLTIKSSYIMKRYAKRIHQIIIYQNKHM